jgi:hypothetical protein
MSSVVPLLAPDSVITLIKRAISKTRRHFSYLNASRLKFETIEDRIHHCKRADASHTSSFWNLLIGLEKFRQHNKYCQCYTA